MPATGRREAGRVFSVVRHYGVCTVCSAEADIQDGGSEIPWPLGRPVHRRNLGARVLHRPGLADRSPVPLKCSIKLIYMYFLAESKHPSPYVGKK